MDCHEFLTYLFDQPQTRELAIELAVAVDDSLQRDATPAASLPG